MFLMGCNSVKHRFVLYSAILPIRIEGGFQLNLRIFHIPGEGVFHLG